MKLEKMIKKITTKDNKTKITDKYKKKICSKKQTDKILMFERLSY